MLIRAYSIQATSCVRLTALSNFPPRIWYFQVCLPASCLETELPRISRPSSIIPQPSALDPQPSTVLGRLKRAGIKTSKMLRLIPAKHRLLLTGTPSPPPPNFEKQILILEKGILPPCTAWYRRAHITSDTPPATDFLHPGNLNLSNLC
jgi:hypothetical protein